LGCGTRQRKSVNTLPEQESTSIESSEMAHTGGVRRESATPCKERAVVETCKQTT